MNDKKDKLKAARFALCGSLAALLVASGCMVGPNYKPPSHTMPATYREPTNGATTAPASFITPGQPEITWWRRFNDPQLTALVEKAVKANNGVAVAEARVRAARAARQVVQSLLYPQVGVGASALRYRISESALSFQGLNLEDNLFTLGFDAAWIVDVFGGNRRGVEAAKANEQASAAERRGVVLMVAAETARAYLELRGTQRELHIAQRRSRSSARHSRSPRRSFEPGLRQICKCCGRERKWKPLPPRSRRFSRRSGSTSMSSPRFWDCSPPRLPPSWSSQRLSRTRPGD